MLTNNMRRLIIMTAITGLGSLAAPAAAFAASAAASGAAKSMTLNVYYGHPSDEIEPLLNLFRKSHPDIDVRSFHQTTDALFTTMGLELSAGSPKADVVQGAANNFLRMEKEYNKPFRRVTVKPDDHLLPGLFQPDMLFVPSQLQTMGIEYNTDKVKGKYIPKGYADLLNPAFKDQLTVADPNSSTSIYGLIWFLGVKLAPKGAPYGWDYFKALGKLSPKLVGSHGTIRTLVASGERPVASQTIDVYQQAVKAKEPVAWVWPAEGIPGITFGWGTFKKSKHPKAADIFLEWLLTKEAQQAVSDFAGTEPVRDDVKYNWPNGVDPKTLNIVPVDAQYIADHRNEILKNFNNAMRGQ